MSSEGIKALGLSILLRVELDEVQETGSLKSTRFFLAFYTEMLCSRLALSRNPCQGLFGG